MFSNICLFVEYSISKVKAPSRTVRHVTGRESGAVIILLHDFPISMSPNEGKGELIGSDTSKLINQNFS